MTIAVNCRFCDHFAIDCGHVVDRPWMKSQNYGAIVSKGALVPGWSLICPVSHSINLAGHYRVDEFWSFAAKAEEVIRSRYGSVRMFEHGPSYMGSPTGCGTDHAHLHLVPLSFSLTEESVQFDRAMKWVPCSPEEIHDKALGREYLYVADIFAGPRTNGMLCVLEEPISQFFRKVVASRLGLRDFYDYRRYPMLEIAESSAVALSSDVLARLPIASR